MERRIIRLLNWLDSRDSHLFLLILYIARWVILVPYMIAGAYLFPGADRDLLRPLSHINPIVLFVLLLVIDPLYEMLIECSLPFWVVSLLHRKKGKLSTRPWVFIVISAGLMTVLHPYPTAIVPSFITGTFLAYTYRHFVFRNVGSAILYTTAFHGGINIVGWAMIVLQLSLR
jgi:hypothetical protein